MDVEKFYRDNDIIAPPQNQNIPDKTIRIIIDSRNRDTSLYPNVAEFEIPLDDEINNVTSLTLISYCVPLQVYTVSATNNVLMFTEQLIGYDMLTNNLVPIDNTQIKKVTITPGVYSCTDLAAALQTAINAISRTTIKVTYDIITYKFTFQSSMFDASINSFIGFSIIACSISRCIGLDPSKNYYGALPQPVRAASTLVYTSNPILYAGQRIVLNDNLAAPQLFNIISVQTTSPAYIVLNGSYPSTIGSIALNHGTIISDMPSSLDQTADYYLLNVKKFRGDNYPRSLPLNTAFAIIHPATHTVAVDNKYVRRLNPPINGVDKLHVRLTTFDGQLCNFQNNDVFFEFILQYQMRSKTRFL